MHRIPEKSKDQRAYVAFTKIIEFVEFFKHLTPVMIISWTYLVTVMLASLYHIISLIIILLF